MRRLLFLTLLACLVVAPAAQAARTSAGDGTLVVRNADGMLHLDITGAVVGRVEGGQLEVVSPNIDECSNLDVWGADREKPTWTRADGRTVCTFAELLFGGTAQPIRFRIVLGRNDTLTVRRGVNFSVSAVGRGDGLIRGTDGSYSRNGEKFVSLPAETAAFAVGATLP